MRRRGVARLACAAAVLAAAGCGVRSGELLVTEGGGLVGYWKLDEGRGTTAVDSTARTGDGALARPIWAAGGFPGARFDDPYCLALDGTQDHVRVPRGPALESQAITVSLWIRRDGAQGVWATALAKTWQNNQPPSFDSWSFQIAPPPDRDPSVVVFETGHPGAVDVLPSPPGVLPDGQWVNLVGVYDPGAPPPQKRLYVAGVMRASRALTAPMVYDATSTGDLYFGQIGGAQQFFRGLADDVRVYARALGDREVTAIASGAAP